MERSSARVQNVAAGSRRRWRAGTAGGGIAALVAAALLLPGALDAQSVLTRTPNLSGGWVERSNVVHFNFVHRFNAVEAGDENVVQNTPTFLLTAPFPGPTLLGVQYASSSLTVQGKQNEWELFGRWAPVSADGGGPLDLAVTAAYNDAAGSGDGELSVALPAGPARLIGVVRGFTDAQGRGEAGWAAGGGVSLRLTDGIALAGDVVSEPDRPAARTTAWGAALQLRVPLTPHTLSLHAANTRTATLQGSSAGHEESGPGEPGTRDQRIVWGFEFTVPITLSRYFGRGGGGETEEPGREAEAGADEAVVTMTDDLRFTPETIRIQAGRSVTWRNTSRLVHTVTADPARAGREESVALPDGADPFDSGDLAPGEAFRHTFRVPGEYVYFCVPHEAAPMVGRVVVTR